MSRASAAPKAMIIGIGSDIIDIRRIERTLERYGHRFIDRIYTPIEQRKSEGRYQRAASYAKRFAAKEACAKALGVGIGRIASWQEIEIVRLPGGKPALSLRGGALARARELGVSAFDLSMSDTSELVMAVVVGMRDLTPQPPP